jgi:hypothetical protein
MINIINKIIMILEFKKQSDKFVGTLGGMPYLENISLWPVNPKTKNKLVHLLSLFPNFQNDSFGNDMCISVFISLERNAKGSPKDDIINEMSVHSNRELNLMKNGYTQVLIHNKKELPHSELIELPEVLPLFFIESRDLTEEEYQREREMLDETDMGIDKSTVLGFPFFEQDRIVPQPPMKYSFKLQLNEWDIDKFENGKYKGIFKGGFGYLWLDNNFRRIKEGNSVGLFCIQW